ncbi:flagellar hook-associated protein 1 FlgK [Evansella caseinilytica]|uniref:Flagellar hook-associated protein 1 n=1 Tax=Evansella caseinilytica TaxID=1503961 RepID=A0A1H3S6J5_9BACI|nr:flagellar hook-associated protein FlgK [Evansella caseinilytica]SDZ33377.1 flagellar hook-associated protein 1 FlgK [Evansella caseinilytica]
MTSTFHGLETARRAMSSHQVALQTVGHNIANANTVGYSRQRANLTATEAYPSPAFNSPSIPGQLGTGVKVGEIQRVRDSFLDAQFRTASTNYGYWAARFSALTRMEDVMNELSDNGLSNTLDRFWQSLQDLSVYPEDNGARSVVKERGLALAETFAYTYNSLQAVQDDYKNQLEVQQEKINSLLRQIDSLNKQIAAVEPHGMLPNDLYDQRDLLVDELSMYMNIKVEQFGSGGLSSAAAEGRYTIKLLDANGRETGVTLVDGAALETREMRLSYDDDTGLVNGIYFAKQSTLQGVESVDELAGRGGVVYFSSLDQFTTSGALRATIEAYGYIDANGNEKGELPEMLAQLDLMVYTFVEAFNEVHRSGWSLSEINAGEKANGGAGYDFFTYEDGTPITADNMKGAAQRLTVNPEIISNLDNIAAATSKDGATAFSGDGSNALALANVKSASLQFGNKTTTLESYFQSVVGEWAVKTNEADRMTTNTYTLLNAAEDRRQSVSGVSLDEEITNLIQFQHAYNAAARNITVIDEMLDRIINGMGIVGR